MKKEIGRIVPLAIRTLPIFWAEQISPLTIFIFYFCGSQKSRFPGPQVSKFPDLQVPRFTNFQIFRFPDFQTPPAPLAPDEFSDPNLNPLPMHPEIKYVASSPCCNTRISQFNVTICTYDYYDVGQYIVSHFIDVSTSVHHV